MSVSLTSQKVRVMKYAAREVPDTSDFCNEVIRLLKSGDNHKADNLLSYGGLYWHQQPLRLEALCEKGC